jgi:hypothetical protein
MYSYIEGGAPSFGRNAARVVVGGAFCIAKGLIFGVWLGRMVTMALVWYGAPPQEE